jgi:hypothetical protein
MRNRESGMKRGQMNHREMIRMTVDAARGASQSSRSLEPAGVILLLALVLGCRTTPEIPGRAIGGAGDDFGYSVQPTFDGGYVIAGATSSFGAAGKDVFLVKTNAAGGTVWTRRYGGPGDDVANSVRQTSDGGYIIAGFTGSDWDSTYYYDACLIRTDAVGDTIWTQNYGGKYWDGGYSVRQTADGGYVLAGTAKSFGAGDNDVYLVKTDANGNDVKMW